MALMSTSQPTFHYQESLTLLCDAAYIISDSIGSYRYKAIIGLSKRKAWNEWIFTRTNELNAVAPRLQGLLLPPTTLRPYSMHYSAYHQHPLN